MISEYVCVPQQCCHDCVVAAAGAHFLFMRLLFVVVVGVSCTVAVPQDFPTLV